MSARLRHALAALAAVLAILPQLALDLPKGADAAATVALVALAAYGIYPPHKEAPRG